MRQIRTDLAMESASAAGKSDLPGVKISAWEAGEVQITEVRIEKGEGAKLLGKAPGVYITLQCEAARRREADARAAVASLLGEELLRLLPADDGRPVLVIGLGNRSVTPDSLGPRTVSHTLVTRHLFQALPESTSEKMQPVCAVAPGVLGVTGIETLEVVKGLVDQVKPRTIVVIDALSARATERLAATVQLTDTGIQPGSGVGNHRSALTQETLGIKVLAIGVPTVIYASTIARDALDLLAGDLADGHDQAMDAIGEKLEAMLGELIVTPREVDELIVTLSQMLASGINQALQPGLDEKEISTMMT
ncbi:MAG: GPR endopeptidase [Clostridia bacterium]